MTQHNSFALQHSDLDAFLFAEVGTERNGMTLTVVSTISRLGEDPWSEARRLSTLPRAAAVDYLTGIIARMPASPWALADATAIATRLVSLLPKPGSSTAKPSTDHAISGPSAPQWTRMLLLYVALSTGLAINMIVFHEHPAVHNHTAEQAGSQKVQASASPSAIPANIPGASNQAHANETVTR